jgi:hypothetical protein
VAEHIRDVGETEVCTSIIVAAELRYGAAKRGSPRLSAQLEAVLGAREVLPFDLRSRPTPPTAGSAPGRQRSADRRARGRPWPRADHRQRTGVCPDQGSPLRELAATTALKGGDQVTF